MNKQNEHLFSLPGVIGYGFGKKETKGNRTNTQALVIFVEKKLPQAQLQDDQIIPYSVNGMVTDVIEIGEVIAHQVPPKKKVRIRKRYWNTDKVIQAMEKIKEELPDTTAIRNKIKGLDLEEYTLKIKTYDYKGFIKKINMGIDTFKNNVTELDVDTTKNNVKSFICNSEMVDRLQVGSTGLLEKTFGFIKGFQDFLSGILMKDQITRTIMMRPARPGLSIGHVRGAAGTFGAVVYDKKTNEPLLLSNNHVIANSSLTNQPHANIGDEIVQPANLDGDNTVIAKLARYAAMRPHPEPNHVDCALARPVSDTVINSEIIDIGKVNGIKEAEVGMIVKKSGRTTGTTSGIIRAVDATINVNYGNGINIRFENQIIATKMSDPGDSGSLVVDKKNNAVGLLFAGSTLSTIINPIQTVLDVLDVRF